MKQHHVIMIYEGEFSQEITKSVLSMTENSFNTEKVDESVKKKVYNIMMESLQNICKHEFKGTENKIPNSESQFMISSTENQYHILTGNAIEKSIIEIIKQKIDQVNSLDADGLKQLYKEARLNSTISAVGGAGLGFIDIARKSGNKISYHFKPLTDNIYYFTQMVTVNKQ
jgi:hypothetical protein